MTSPATQTYSQSFAQQGQAHDVEMWRAAETVRARVSDPEGRHELLGALGLLDVRRPGQG